MADLNYRRAKFVYEGARLAAVAAEAPIVPEPYDDREQAFRDQFERVIKRQMGTDRSSNAEQLHEDWVTAYRDMGWVYGDVRDPERKTHPDMVPYNALGHLERDKDAVFVALCEIARKWIHAPSVPCDDKQELEAENAQLRANLAEAQTKLAKWEASADRPICLWCQTESSRDPAALAAHLMACRSHPLTKMLDAQGSALTEALVILQRLLTVYNDAALGAYCPICHMATSDGCKPDCRLAALLANTKQH